MRPRPEAAAKPSTPPRIKPFYAALIEWVYANRFVLGEQVGERFHNWLHSPRSTDRHVQTLVQLGYLGRAGVRTPIPNNLPHAFYATARGLRLVAQEYQRQGLLWQPLPGEENKSRGRAEDTMLHEIMLSQLTLDIGLTVESRDELEVLFSERRWWRSPLLPAAGNRKAVEPDLGFLTATHLPAGDRRLLMHFVELDRGGLSLERWRERLDGYLRWAETVGEDYLRALYHRWDVAPRNPRWRPAWKLLIICQNKDTGKDSARLRNLFSLCLDLPPHLRRVIWLTTVAALERHAQEDPPLGAPMWVRVADVGKDWLAAYHRATDHLTRESDRTKARRRLVTQRLLELARRPWALFPPEKAAHVAAIGARQLIRPSGV